MNNTRSENALNIYNILYFNPDETTPEEVHDRVSKCISAGSSKLYDSFKYVLDNDIFRPNTPCLINSRINKNSNQISIPDKNLVACFVLGLEDSMESIIEMWSTCATVYAGGGGTGIPLSNLREAKSPIACGGKASGPLEYLKTVQSISRTVKSGGKARRAANLVSFWYKHPDILSVINCKQDLKKFDAINISILVDDEFMEYVCSDNLDIKIPLISPNHNIKDPVGYTTVRKIWTEIVHNAWLTGDPGLLFKTTANKFNPTPSRGEMKTSNPCLPDWAPVLTSTGYKPFKKIKNEVLIENQIFNCSDLIPSGKKEIFKVELSNGIRFFCTEDHKIYTLINEKQNIYEKIPLKDLSNKNYIKVDYSPISYKFDENLFKKGLFAGNFISLLEYLDDIKCSELIENIIDDEFASNCIKNLHIKTKKEKDRTIIINSLRILYNNISYNLGVISGIVSKCIKIINTETFKSFYICFYRRKINIKVLYDIQLILASLGIYSSIKRRYFENTNTTKYYLYILDLKRFLDLFSPLIKTKKYEQMYKLYLQMSDIEKQNLELFRNKQKIKKISKFSDELFDVYDIQVPNINRFVTSTVQVSNCGEVLLPDNSCCDLGSINLNKCLVDPNNDGNYIFDFDLFRKYIHIGVEFLDNIIDVTSYPNSVFETNMKTYRPIGLGLMGLSDIFYKMKIRYASKSLDINLCEKTQNLNLDTFISDVCPTTCSSIQFFSLICKFLTTEAIKKSIELAKTKGAISLKTEDYSHFINLLIHYGCDENTINEFKKHGIRNSTWTSIAPTGSISITCDCSYSFEPAMALIWEKPLSDRNKTLYFFNQIFKDECEKRKIDLNEKLVQKIIQNKGSIQNIDEFPADLKHIFVTAHDINYFDKIDMQSAGQLYISLGISSTCNLPNNATKENISDIFKYAWKKKLKGITVYRDGCRDIQPVNFGKICKKDDTTDKFINEPIKLPNRRSGHTIKIATPFGSIYITGNKVDNKLVEIFLNMGRIGKLENILMNTLSKIISKALQYNVPLDTILNQMEEEGGYKFWFKLDEQKGYSISAESIIDAIAKVIRYHFNNEEVDGFKLDLSEQFENNNYINKINNIIDNNKTEKLEYSICPNCGKKSLLYSTGCRGGSCQNPECSYSACG